jgi:hypothetical protein
MQDLDYLLIEKDRLLKKYGCNTIVEVIALLERKIAEKQIILDRP